MNPDELDSTPRFSDFDLDRSIDEAWANFSHRLGEVLSVMDAGGTLAIGVIATETGAPPAYVTFTCEEGGRLLAEAAGNARLGDGFRLSDEQVRSMSALGWRAPEVGGPRAREDLWREGDQEHAVALASEAVSALRDVYGVQHPAFLAPDQLAEILVSAPVEELPHTNLPRWRPTTSWPGCRRRRSSSTT